MGAPRLLSLAALLLALVALPPAQAVRAHASRSLAVRAGRYGSPSLVGRAPGPATTLTEEEEHRPRLPHQNADVLHKLFGDMDLGSEDTSARFGEHVDKQIQETGREGAESKRPSMHYDDEDDAFLGVVAKLLEVVDASPSTIVPGRPVRWQEGDPIPRLAMTTAARDKKFPHFEEFVGDVFDEADEDQDGALNAGEAEHFTDLLRQHVAHAVFGGGGDEADMAVSRVMRVLTDHPEGGIELQALGEAAVTHFFPELLELVHELFEDADEDKDGVLDKDEAATFKQLFEETILYGKEAFAELHDLETEEEEDESSEESSVASSDEDAESSDEAPEGTDEEPSEAMAAEEEADEEDDQAEEPEESTPPAPTNAQEVMAEPVA